MHNPLPSPSRAMYGFALYILSAVVFGVYLVWAYVPSDWLRSVGIVYFPQKYWAVAAPIYFASLFLFVLALYVGYSLVLTPHLSSINTIQDKHSNPPLESPFGVRLRRSDGGAGPGGEEEPAAIPHIGDIPVHHVNTLLYRERLSAKS
ncbi:phosphatidylinositol N-acetylglucosaminyltransferase subunit P-like [Sycon ciliatum]|uniref:phosphatidylinositol N-acetylglucosaminyltransferase subunit P-like n=1 Tax=Sycon ciliatum TaxID=27933 RepID=UPI0031F65B78|eukprot:scpid92593/ scgid12912/ Phosphatidylinositol N-acetylglucosaminyltransferase subunit P; Down syndrome critical region protein 5 homolog; Phosphatidylinositol-glycan biosynthesis class P protein